MSDKPDIKNAWIPTMTRLLWTGEVLSEPTMAIQIAGPCPRLRLRLAGGGIIDEQHVDDELLWFRVAEVMPETSGGPIFGLW